MSPFNGSKFELQTVWLDKIFRTGSSNYRKDSEPQPEKEILNKAVCWLKVKHAFLSAISKSF